MTRQSSGDYRAYDPELSALSRRQDAFCVFFFGKTLNGEGPMDISPSPESWCGRMMADQKEIKRVAVGLRDRLNWGIASVVGATAIIKFAVPIWEHFTK